MVLLKHLAQAGAEIQLKAKVSTGEMRRQLDSYLKS